MPRKLEQLITGNSHGSTPKSKQKASTQGKNSSERPPSVKENKTGTTPALAADHPAHALAKPWTPTEQEQMLFTELKAKIEMYNRAVPELRITLPSDCMYPRPFLSLNLRICEDHYFKCAALRFAEDAANKIGASLTSLLEQHPLEWLVCAWKNDFIAEIMLGRLNCSGEKRKKAAENWLRSFWKREGKLSRQADRDLSPKRMAAWSAIGELEWLHTIDKDPEPLTRPGFRSHTIVIRWLNKNWPTLAAKKKGQALLDETFVKLRSKHRHLPFDKSDLSAICEAYKSIASMCHPGKVPANQVVLALVALQCSVSPRLVTSIGY